MIKLKKLLLFILSGCILVFSSCMNTGEDSSAESSAASEESEPAETLIYWAFGDSISYGYGLEAPAAMSFPALIAESKKNSYNDVLLTNFSISGMDSTDLIEQLANVEAKEGEEVDIITVCIGANNVLGYVLGMLYTDVQGDESSSLADFITQYMATGTFDGEITLGMISAITKLYTSLSTLDTNEEVLARVELLREHIPQIISSMRTKAPDAEIYYMTVYNPYKGVNIGFDGLPVSIDLGAYGDRLVGMVNSIITELAEENGYIVVNVYEAFESGEKLVNATAGGSIDPHPTAIGQQLIADTFIKKMAHPEITSSGEQ